jgi:hypothetical protein
MAGGILRGRHAQDMAIADVEFCTVPWACDAISVELSVTQSSSIMRTEIFDAVDMAVDGDGNDKSILDFERLRGIGLELSKLAKVLEFAVADDRIL